jgi:CxxC motif-containing protein (DUF1111 family)
MRRRTLEEQRKLFGIGLLLVVSIGLLWHFSPGLPVLIGPWASASTRQSGMELFVREWQPNDPLAHGDGLGPVFNARSCVACHHQGGVGGGGGNSFNVTNFVVSPNRRDREMVAGTIHTYAVAKEFQESFELVRKRYPVIKGGERIVDHCRVFVADVDPLSVESIQTTALWGAGWLDRISDKAILQNRRGNLWSGIADELQAKFNDIPIGRVRRLPGGKIGRFGWKAQFATLEEFVAAACANELGLGTPYSRQAQPLGVPDYPEMKPDLNRGQFRDLVAFVATLPRPIEEIPASLPAREQVELGRVAFHEAGCAICHVPDLGGVKGIYSDLLLHRITDPSPSGGGSGYGRPAPPPDVPIPDGEPHPDEWRTPPLWGVADSAPYMHDGSAPTLDAAIHRHGGAARPSRDAYRRLPREKREALLAFLGTLKAPPDAIPVTNPVEDNSMRRGVASAR